ncbi:MAG: hypothetical protein M5U19_15015 [Microthrixaceae bacterium]|nr:hypothetical protein [Microthrixaceae bacterium]
MAEADILYMVVKQFAEIDLHPDAVSNLEMGHIYEELIRVTARPGPTRRPASASRPVR